MPDHRPPKPHVVPDDQLAFIRQLRQEQTDAEAKIWSRLRDRRLGGFKFRRQFPCGPYSLDFFCMEARVAVELDGGQHSEPECERHDEERTAFLESQGIIVVRFWNHNALRDTDAVCRTILRAVSEPGSVRGRIGERARKCEPSRE